MPRPTSPGGRLLDLMVFGPAGLAITAVEEFPKLADKGRRRVEHDVATAHMVGRVAVRAAQRRLERTVARLGSGPPTVRSPAARRVERRVVSSLDDDLGPPSARTPLAANVARGPRTDASPPAGSPATSDIVTSPMPTTINGHSDSPALGIPRYDSLSASQVVQRLDGLSPAELEAVRVHERTHRQRRTILHRVDQLLAGTGGEHA